MLKEVLRVNIQIISLIYLIVDETNIFIYRWGRGGGIVSPSAAPRGIFVKNSTKKYWTFPSRGFAEINQHYVKYRAQKCNLRKFSSRELKLAGNVPWDGRR